MVTNVHIIRAKVKFVEPMVKQAHYHVV